ncbi:MAG: ATPase, T2SS/T4P/T4SS family [bacterium]
MSVLSADTEQKVENFLVKKSGINPTQLKALKVKSNQDNVPFITLLINQKLITEENLTEAIASANTIPYVNLSEATISAQTLDLLPKDIAERFMAVPLGEIGNRLAVAMLDADNIQAVDFLASRVNRPVKVYLASEGGIKHIFKQYDAQINKSLIGDFSSSERKNNEASGGIDLESMDVQNISQDSPISKIITSILMFAARNKASDVHIEPTKDFMKIRCRIDGILREVTRLPKIAEPPLISRIKILSNLKIDEHRIPQDGQFSIKAGNKDIDLRIAISPTIWGEQVVIRLLDKSGTSLNLEDMGYVGRSLRLIRDGMKQTSGMILTSGPTGSGKSTSLYALINEIKSDSVNIVTLEDPVEYKMEGINQIQVNSEVGLTFASGLRSILRQDPNVVMVGEIRDKETAELAVQAALTGHLVFSTLHTNSAAGILPRLLDMGIEPFLIASTVRTVIGQRLVRRIGENKENYISDQIETGLIDQTLGKLLPEKQSDIESVGADLGFNNLPLRGSKAYTLTRGINSSEAPGGYKGRMGIYEVFSVTEKIQDLILKRSTSLEIEKMAKAEGMISMREDGFLKALSGLTTLNEVNRVASMSKDQ